MLSILAHALVTGLLVLATMWGLRRTGLVVPPSEGGPRFSWITFVAIFVVIAILNLIWPWP